MYDFIGNLPDLMVFGVLAALVVMMIVMAEIMRATARHCERSEAVARLRVSIGLFRTAILLLLMYGANQALETHELKTVERNSKPAVDGSKIAEAVQPAWTLETASGNVITVNGDGSYGVRGRTTGIEFGNRRIGVIGSDNANSDIGSQSGRSGRRF